MKILLADEDGDLRAVLGFTLKQAGYDSCGAGDGSNALHAFDLEAPDLVLLDINIPSPDGIEVCRQIRLRSRVPIMVLSSRTQEDDMIAALDAGADDYVRKPINPRPLIARIRALLRRADSGEHLPINAGYLRLDPQRMTLTIGNLGPITLTPLELKALQLLMRSPQRTVTVEKMLIDLWGRAAPGDRRSLKQLIYRLRRKIEPDPSAPQIIQTTPHAGYKLVID